MLPFAKRSYLLSQVHIVKLFIDTDDTDFIKLIVSSYIWKNESKGQELRLNFEIVNV